MTAVADALSALRAYVLTDATLIALLGTRVFNESLPESESASMPRKALVLRESGGVEPNYAQGTLEIQAQRIDAFCYGENFYEARRVRLALRGVMRNLVRVRQSGVLLHWARPGGGAVTFVDGEAEWPGLFESYQVLSSEVAAA